jgi:transcriptional antiterminator
VPGYWTIDELAKELNVTMRKVQYDIKGNPRYNQLPKLKAYMAGKTFLVADEDALPYLHHERQKRS